MSKPLAHRVSSSVRLTMGVTLAAGVIQLITMAVLARLLDPIDYGTYVVALSIGALSTQFLASVAERSMAIEPNVALLNGRSVSAALAIAAIGTLVLGFVAIVKETTGWRVDLGVLAVVFASQTIGALALMPRALLRRELRFGPIVVSELLGQFLGSLCTAAVLAWLGFGAYALALAGIVQAGVIAVWMLVLAPPGVLRPRFRRLGGLPAIFFGMLKPTTLEAVNGQISPLVVSSVLGPVQLGLFNRIYNIVTMPVQLLISSVNRVLISTLVAVADDLERRRRSAQFMIRAASALIAPMALGLAGSGDSFIAVLLGPKWLSAAPIVPFLAVAVWGNMLGAVLGQLAEAVQRFDHKARIQGISTISLILVLLGGSPWGLVGVAIGAMVAAMLFALLYIYLSASILELQVRVVMGWLLPGAVAGAACFASGRVIGWALASESPALTLIFQIAACGAVTTVVLVALDRPFLLDLSGLLLPRRVNALALRLLAPSQKG